MKQGNKGVAEFFEEASVYFSDIVGFTKLASESQPMEVVGLLNDLYGALDVVIARHHVYKVYLSNTFPTTSTVGHIVNYPSLFLLSRFVQTGNFIKHNLLGPISSYLFRHLSLFGSISNRNQPEDPQQSACLR